MDRLRAYKPTILVVGDLMLDHYLWGKCERISPEAPVQVVEIQKETTVLGGAGNVVTNLIELGASVWVASVIGDDRNGDEVEHALKDLGIDVTTLIRQSGRKTSKKSRVVASHQQVIRYDSESKEPIDEAVQKCLTTQCERVMASVDAVLLSDYGKGVLTHEMAQSIIALGKKFQKPVLVDPKGDDYRKYKGATLITPNKKEAGIATQIAIVDDNSLRQASQKLKETLGLRYAIITLSEEGIGVFDTALEKFPTVAREVYDVTGAGDTVLASLGYALSCGYRIQEAVGFANKAAAVVVGKLGSATVSLDEVEAYGHTQGVADAESKIKTKEEMLTLLRGKKHQIVVFTNGCFDLLHVGHVTYLQTARKFGDMLIVGLNSDASIKRLKGKSRPIYPLEDRAYILASLESVSYVVPFEEDTPYELIRTLQPDILVKGADYEGKEVVGSELVKEVRLVEFVQGKSTTNTLKQVQNPC